MQEKVTPAFSAGKSDVKPLLGRAITAKRSLAVLCLALICALTILRFSSLTADFPNWSPWMEDQAKFTDEGWWASGAVNHSLLGHWNLPGDYNPAAALPVWPFLLGLLFHFTGMSIVAARALNVALSIVTIGFVYWLVRRCCGVNSPTPAVFAALLLASSPFAYAFSRLAILEPLVIFEFCLALLLASFLTPKRLGLLAALTLLICCMILTKTTAALLVPAVFWMAWRTMGGKLHALALSLAALIALPAALCKGYALLVAKLGYGSDYKYFFDVNAMETIDFARAWTTTVLLFQHGFWIDRVLFPVALAVLVLSISWKRNLRRNPLFAASWIALSAQAVFVFTRGEDYAPRYYLTMLVPLVLVVVLALAALMEHERKTAALLALAMVASAVANILSTIDYATSRSYDLQNAAIAIRKTIREDPKQNPLILGVSASQISLMTGIPSINDAYSVEDMSKKVAIYKPGWYLAWNGVPESNIDFLSPYRLEEAGSYPLFDDDDRHKLVLYKMIPRPAASLPPPNSPPSSPQPLPQKSPQSARQTASPA
jgi:hypothetical protein